MPDSPDSPDGALRLTPGVDEAPSINPRLAPGRRRAVLPVEAYAEGIRAGDRVMLSQAITLVESTRPDHQAVARALIERCLPHAGGAVRVGITGVPGVGKSTFIEALGSLILEQGSRLAVLAIDPTSSRSRGSILGDKTRMPHLATSEKAFIRPSPTSGSLGGVARRTREAMLLCEAAGYEVVFVETVGVGQSEVAVHAMVDFFLLLALAGAGDELQGIKRGIIEMADAIVVTKTDGENIARAKAARTVYRSALRLFPPKASGWAPRVLTCSAFTGDGIAAVWRAIEDFLATTRGNGTFAQHRRRQALAWMQQAIEARLLTDFADDPAVQAARPALEAAVEAGQMSSFAAARRLLALYHGTADHPGDTEHE